jgi:TolB-like protein/tetratricopeptide (TPR) repeat protein
VALAALAWAFRAPATRPSVAVRFEYDGHGSADAARIADGITIEITRLLAQIDGLDVRAAVRASRYGDQRADSRVFGMARGAGLVLEGLMLSDAGAVRHIHASLVSASMGTVLWSESFAPVDNDVFAVQRAIVTATAEALGLQPSSGQRQYSLDPALQMRFLSARALQADSGNASRPEAVDLFDEVTKKASSFPPAFAALATTRGGHLSIAGPPPLDPRTAAAAHAAYEADPRLAEANVAMGLLSARTCEWTRADAYFSEALRLDASATAAYTDYVISTLLPLGRIADSLEVLRKALATDPTSVDVRRVLAYVQLQNDDHEKALETTRWVIEHDPDRQFADQSHGRALYLSRRIEEALEWLNKNDSQWGNRGYALALTGRTGEARTLADAHPGEPARQLLIYAGLNDVERAFDAFRRTALDNPWRAQVWAGWPEIEPILRGHPGAAAIKAQLIRPADEGGCTVVSASSLSGVYGMSEAAYAQQHDRHPRSRHLRSRLRRQVFGEPGTAS